LIDKIWEDRPSKPNSTIYNYDVSFAGEERTEKIAKCRNFLDTHGGEDLVITNPEILCWLFNIRAADIEFSPLLLANGYITKENSYLFTDSTRIQGDLKGITIVPETAFIQIIQQQQGKILFDDNLCSKYISDIIKQKEHQNVVNPCLLWKSCKNSVEIDKMIEAHIQDGVAAVEFLSFLASNDLSKYSEYDLGLKLKDFRSKGYNYVTDSFPAIIGFKENGAIIHYRASQKSAKKMVGDGLLLIDSGGQYLGATTDITRVAVIGKPEQKYREYYTKILKGHLNLAMIKFPKESVTGANLDILARQFLWQDGDDYPHGTGHGVGSFLSVHEGPQNISLTSYGTKLAAGMVISNEPGFYQPGEFGIRIENMMYVKETTNSDFLEFGMLTLVPYEKNLIDKDLLSKDELNYLTCYYKLIEKKIMPHLSDEGKKWLHTQLQLVN
jgi:Xaa-Pro aminopeptidase